MTNLLVDNFESYSLGTWAQSTTQGNWFVQFNGNGSVGVETDGTQVAFLKPQAATMANETHAALITSTASIGAMDLSIQQKTLQQLRQNNPPNPWEVAWIIWRYTDNTHFYNFVLKTNGWELDKEDPNYAGNQRFMATGNSPSLSLNTWNTIRVLHNDTTMTVFVDGTQVVAFTDTERPYLSGNIGLYCEDSYVHFDNVNVISPVPAFAKLQI